MKRVVLTRSLLFLLISVLISLHSFNLYAQTGVELKGDSIDIESEHLNLSVEQYKKIKDLRAKHLLEVTQLKKELAEKEAQLIIILSADSIDSVAMNKTIDEISIIQGKLLKNKINHRLNVSKEAQDNKKLLLANLIKLLLEILRSY